MQVFVNNKELQTETGTLAALISQLNLPAQGVAAAVNNKMVPRTEWENYALAEGIHVTIIKAACGG